MLRLEGNGSGMMSEKRKLAAILAADVVGYSRLTGADEDRTLARLRALRSDLIDPTIAVHKGRVVKRTGDGALVEFRSVVDAVRCAIEVQNGMVERNAGLPPERRIEFRIGIHLGDVVEESDGDLMGDGVNIAARLEGVAMPGAICLSEDAYRQVKARLDLSVSDLGETKLKNIVEPMRIYSLEVGGAVHAKPATQAEAVAPAAPSKTLTLPDKPSIAVLPFQNMSHDPEQEFFADGMVEDIITALSRIKWLFVIGRNSSFAYKGKSADIRQVGRELGVRYVLEGSVRKVGNRVRITGQMLEAETGAHVWAERYDRVLDDIFELQDEITGSIVGCLEPQLYAAEHARLQRKPPQSLDAWECFIRAVVLFGQHSEEGSCAALSLLDNAIGLDPKYGQAHGLKGYTLVWRAFQSWEDMRSAIERATVAATRAIACDSQDPWAYLARGMVAIATRDNSEAVNAFRHATSLSPNFAYAHALLGAAHALGGKLEDATQSVDQAVRLSPRDTFSDDFQLFYAFAHFQAGRYAEAASFAETAIQLRPEHPISHVMAAASYGLAGHDKKAVEASAKLRGLVPEITASNVEETFPYVLAEDRARLAQGLRKAGLPN
jgi:adenylate cyclase